MRLCVSLRSRPRVNCLPLAYCRFCVKKVDHLLHVLYVSLPLNLVDLPGIAAPTLTRSWQISQHGSFSIASIVYYSNTEDPVVMSAPLVR